MLDFNIFLPTLGTPRYTHAKWSVAKKSLHNSYKQFYQYSVNTKITVFNAKTQFALVHHQLALSVQVPSQAVVLIKKKIIK